MILVTGSGGPMGAALRTLDNCGMFSFVTSKDFDLTNYDQSFRYLKTLVEERGIEGIIHLAARSGGSLLSKNFPASLMRDNLVMTLNLLEISKSLGIKRLVLTLSTAAYSDELENPTELQLHTGPLTGIDYGYGYAKRLLQPLMNAYNQQYSMQISSILVNGIVGPYMNFREGESILPASLIRRFSKKALENDMLEVWGDGSPIREYTLSTDLARAAYWCYFNQDPNTVLNIGSSEKITVRQCALTIARLLGIDESRLTFDSSKPNGRQRQSTNNEQFKSLSNFEYTSFDKSIAITLEWYKFALENHISFRF
jgi:GDP-L-fucose synthase